jgi:hypothetical protein
LGVVLLLALGCSDPAKHGAAASTEVGGSGTDDDDSAGASATNAGNSGSPAQSCNDLELDAPAWGLTYDPDPSPEPLGGEIADGIYFVTSEVRYNTASGPTELLGRTKIVIEGTTWQEVEGEPEPSDTKPDQHRTRQMSVSDTELILRSLCPSAGEVNVVDYTADAQQFTIYFDAGGRTSSTFTKQ